MLDLLYDLTPGEDPSLVDGQLFVVLLGDDLVSDAVERICLRRLDRLEDCAEFQMAIVRCDEFSYLNEGGWELPALLHFRDGERVASAAGVDDCVDYIKEIFRRAK